MATNIPYGYTIKSRKGNSYIKTPNGWVSNGKPANQGIIKNLEAAAERKIEEYNDSPDNLVKIGQEYKSNNGKVYFYNGTNFMSADGKKKLAGGAQESAMRKLQQSAESEGSEAESTQTPMRDLVVPVGYAAKNDDGLVYTKTPSGWDAYKDGNVVSKVTLTNNGWVDDNGEPVDNKIINAITDTALARIKAYNDSPEHKMKIGQQYTHGDNSYTFNGSEFLTRDGKQLAHEYVPQAKAQLVKDTEGKQSTQEPTTGDDGNADVTEPESNMAEPETEQPEPTADVTEPETTSGGQSLQDLADAINKHPQKRKLVALMSRGDKISMLAADIILSGKAADAVKQLSAIQ